MLLLLLLLPAPAPALRPPVLLLPGDGGNQLEARGGPPGCPQPQHWYRLWLDVWRLSAARLACWAETIRLEWDGMAGRNVAGVETRVPGWGDTDSVEYLDPSWSAWLLGDAGNYLHGLVTGLVTAGYTRGRDLRAAPYDFRFAPHSQAGYFRRLAALVEEMFHNSGNQTVTLVSHSLGGLFGLFFLQRQPPAWKQKFIRRFLPLSTPWRGAVVQLNTYASGYNMGITMIDPLVIRAEQRSYQTGVLLLPLPHTWQDRQQVLVRTPEYNYTVRDYSRFFSDIGFPQGEQMLNIVQGAISLTHPGVATSCVYSLGLDTPVELVYSAGQFPDSQPAWRTGPGDGTVTLDSAMACTHFLTRPGDEVTVFGGLSHSAILRDSAVIEFIKSRLLSNK